MLLSRWVEKGMLRRAKRDTRSLRRQAGHGRIGALAGCPDGVSGLTIGQSGDKLAGATALGAARSEDRNTGPGGGAPQEGV